MIVRLIEPTRGQAVVRRRGCHGTAAGALAALPQDAQIVFQNPNSSLNPRRSIGDAIARAVELHSRPRRPRSGARASRAARSWSACRARYYDRYPHQLSGGEKQRVGIARALATEPAFIVCDEPVSALDVSVQATILNLLEDLRDRLGVAYLFISHDLSVVAHVADRIAVMYARPHLRGRVRGKRVLRPPHHPYTEALLSAVPFVEPAKGHQSALRSTAIPRPCCGPAQGCVFANRCPRNLGAICRSARRPAARPPTAIASSATSRWGIWKRRPGLVRAHMPPSREQGAAMKMPLTVPPKHGHPSMLYSKVETDLDKLDAHIAFLGIPYGHPYSFEDVTNNEQPSAPTAMRQASDRAVRSLERYDFDIGGPLYDGKPIKAVDCGDVPGNMRDHKDHFAARRDRRCARSWRPGALPIVIGGDHAIPIPVLRAFEGRGPITLVQIDAHIDWRDDVNGVRDGLSSPIRRASEMEPYREDLPDRHPRPGQRAHRGGRGGASLRRQHHHGLRAARCRHGCRPRAHPGRRTTTTSPSMPTAWIRPSCRRSRGRRRAASPSIRRAS